MRKERIIASLLRKVHLLCPFVRLATNRTDGIGIQSHRRAKEEGASEDRTEEEGFHAD